MTGRFPAAGLTLDAGVLIQLERGDERVRVGVLAGRSGCADVVDVSVALCAAERRGVVVTTDPGDIDAVGLDLALIAV